MAWRRSHFDESTPTHLSTITALVLMLLGVSVGRAEDYPTRDLAWFLQRLRNVEHLPELEASHTAMSSTWDRTGGNADGTDFKRIESGRNILLDVDGPGCIHRIFVGVLGAEQAETRIQLFLDGAAAPLLDLPILEFFKEESGPLPYPLVFHKTYPGTLFPIPFAKHCLIQLVNPKFGKPGWQDAAWSNYWQVTYTTYPKDTKVESLRWPLSDADQAEAGKTCRAWLAAMSRPPAEPAVWSVDQTVSLSPDATDMIVLPDCGVIREVRVVTEPATPEVLRGLRMQFLWDGAAGPSVDVPLGYFFGHGDSGHNLEAVSPGVLVPENQQNPMQYTSNFNSLLLGVTPMEAYSRFPMPFAKGAVLRIENRTGMKIDKLRVRLDVERRDALPDNWGRFHVTWTEERAATEATPKFGPQNVPCKTVLEERGRGKYVGVLLHVAWPTTTWWGEGDWIIWTDEDGWPPSYHGTGSEEYFNSGWGTFDRKAVSGFVAERPGHPTLYSFHLNDAFQFQKDIRVVEEQMGCEAAAQAMIVKEHPIWGTTAYWYAPTAQRARSRYDLLSREKKQ
jgi:hypothetical protein